MSEYYTMESVRSLISGKYDVRTTRENPVPVPSWNRYPCPVIKRCERKKQVKCIGYISIFINTETIRWIFLEICFFREKQRAFIRADGLQMLKLLELGIISNESLLTKEAL